VTADACTSSGTTSLVSSSSVTVVFDQYQFNTFKPPTSPHHHTEWLNPNDFDTSLETGRQNNSFTAITLEVFDVT